MDQGSSLRRFVGTPGSALLVCLGLSLPVCSSRQPGIASDGGRSRLVAAVGERRLLHGRATGGFAFGPEQGRKRGVSKRPDVPFEVLRVSAELRKEFDADPSPVTTGNLALAYLLNGDAEKGARLAELRVLEEETPEALVDLSAAQLERAIKEGATDQFAHAYDSALRALRRQPGQKEALFNRAMAVDGMGLAWVARQAWEEYLAIESEGPWSEIAREARARAAVREADNDRAAKDRPRILAAWATKSLDVVREIAFRRPDLAREVVRREALPSVARAKLEGRSPGLSLSLARELNGLAEAADGDTLDREAMALLERGDTELAAAHVEFAGASQALDDRKVDAGSPGVLHAAAVFKRKGSPYAAQAELQAALVDFFHGRRDGLIARYTAMLGQHQGRYPLLRARALWMRALCHDLVSLDKWQTFLDRRAAFAILTDAHQMDPARQLASQLWTSLSRLGREAEAAGLLVKMVSSLSLEDVPLRTYAVIETLTEYLRDRGLPLAALEIRERAQASTSRGGPTLRVNAALDMVELATELDDRAAAARSIEVAAHSLHQIEDREIRTEEEIVLGLATLAAGPLVGRPAAIGLDGLIPILRERENEVSLQKALTLLGEQRLREGKPDLSEAALQEALDIHLASRAKTAGEFERIKQFETAERPADNLVDLLAAAGRSEEALSLIERLRNPEAVTTGLVGRLQMSLLQEDALVSYWTLKNRILASVVTLEGTRDFSLPVGRTVLRNLVQRLNASIEVESEQLVTASLSDLYEALVSPLVPALGSARRLVIVPDRDLWDVPFAGLGSAGQTKPLAVRYEIAFASSLFELTRSRGVWTKPRSVLAIGNPAWDKTLFGELEPLPESLNEARGVASLYQRSRVLGGAEATRAAVQRLAPQFDVIHIATHAVGNDRDPGESFLLLSAEASEPGTWRASDPGWEALSKARLVVLSACRTANQRSRFGGASMGVLRSIRLATTAQILASTGDVDDAASRRLLEAFHRHLVAGQTPAAALRQAQTDAYRERSGMTWMLYRIVT